MYHPQLTALNAELTPKTFTISEQKTRFVTLRSGYAVLQQQYCNKFYTNEDFSDLSPKLLSLYFSTLNLSKHIEFFYHKDTCRLFRAGKIGSQAVIQLHEKKKIEITCSNSLLYLIREAPIC